MEIVEKKSALGYGKPPWLFKGSALYQLHLVKAETARALIPKEFKLVEAFGYTLGGFFLANYEDSPAGNFDELVVLAGIVWNPPTSCAWAARVLVSSGQACAHGRKEVGLPSQVASFTKRVTTLPETKRGPFHGLLNKIPVDDSSENMKSHVTILVEEMIDNHKAMSLGSINLTTDALITPQIDTKRWMGPLVKLSLPSFSGRTEFNPDLLKYSCQIECRLRAVQPARVVGPLHSNGELTSDTDGEDIRRNLSMSIMLSKPILALEFSRLNMKVEAPTTVVPQ